MRRSVRPVLTAVDRSHERARRFGHAHTKHQPPQKVVFTLLDMMAPEAHIVGSPHETTVITPGSKDPLCKLKAGEKASFDCTVTEETDGEGKVVGKKYSWSRRPEKAEPAKDDAKAAAVKSSAAAPAASSAPSKS